MKGRDKILLKLAKLSDEELGAILELGMIDATNCVTGKCLIDAEFCKNDKSEVCGETILHYLKSEVE